MRYIYNIIKADYLQRTRSYSFLITLAVTIYVAYLFVPPVTASYTTLSTVGLDQMIYKGAFNSAWVGYVSAIMTSVMLSFYGFLLVNNGIKKDIDTEVGLIIATTPISNFTYLLSKQLSNFLVLLTITGCTFLVSIIMFFVRGSGYTFVFTDFLLPYLIFALPALFLVSALAVVAEVFLGRKSILQFIIYFFLCGAVMGVINTTQSPNIALADPFGLTVLTNSVKAQINAQFQEHISAVSFGFIFSAHKAFKVFVWNGLNWQAAFLFSRITWIILGLTLVYISSFFFHRFDFKQAAGKGKKMLVFDEKPKEPGLISQGLNRVLMPPIVTDYGIFPFMKTELLLLIRKGNKWLWLLNGVLWIATLFAPLSIAYGYLLPVLLFLQVTRWSELATKEKTNRLHYFTYASYKPLLRMLPAQILAGIALAVALALPVILRCIIASDGLAVVNILNGSIFIVLLSVCLGIVSSGKKLYEILFFLLTYCVCNKIPFADYLVSMPHAHIFAYISVILFLNIFLATASFLARGYQARHL